MNLGENSYITNPKVYWFFGHPGAGKTQLAIKLLIENTIRLDGDILRAGLCEDLSLSIQDRKENIRRAAHVAKILINTGISPICSFITPLNVY